MKVAKECRTKPKADWHYMKTTNRVASRVPNLRKPDGTFTSSDADIANTLNQQYSSVFTKEDTNNLPDFPLKNLITAELKNFEISEADVLKELQDLKPNKSPGVDGLHPRVLKELSAELVKPITILLKQSLEAEALPAHWLQAVVAPIFKKGSKSLPENY